MNRPLTYEEAAEIARRPFFITYIGRSYPWAGVITADRFPVGRTGEELIVDDNGTALRVINFGPDLDEIWEQTPVDAGFFAGGKG